ncbi:hypothetical protein EDB37_101045 [Vibrio crassostreae]|nr:hypothetical protein EDB37_101045 [Vibrio crassostreae]
MTPLTQLGLTLRRIHFLPNTAFFVPQDEARCVLNVDGESYENV